MASTTIFAPVVRAMQSASVSTNYSIYFKLSSFNNMVDIQGLLYSIVDPGVSSTRGSSSMFTNSNQVVSFIPKSSWRLDGEEPHIVLSLTGDKYKTFLKDKFYQMQLYFVDASMSSDEFTKNDAYTLSWLKRNSNYISETSQPTLIRLIDNPTINFIQAGTEDSPLYDFSILSGSMTSNETFDSYTCEIYTNDNSLTPIWSYPGWIKGSGRTFSIPIDNNIVIEDQDYNVRFSYRTNNGYESYQYQDIYYGKPSGNGPDLSGNSKAREQDGGIFITTSPTQSGTLQRSEKAGSWKTVNSSFNGSWTDFSIESDVLYTYRLVDNSYRTGDSISLSASFEDIFLSDETAMIAVRYNPVISGFKYVTQESITNTLGGQYPIIRKNGDTHYRQFNLSGTIDNSISTAISQVDSVGRTVSDNSRSSLYLRGNSITLSLPSNLNSVINRQKAEKAIRVATLNFLTNGKPKLFRSFEEGNMIVYLTNVSFTPNKTSGGHIYDFSATVTEFCECNEVNLAKYHLNLDGYNAVTIS